MKVEIERLGHLGDGVADGPIFVSRTLPGEVVEGDLAADRLVDVRIVTPSSDRVKPPCKHYRQCGGCSLQHASDDFVADWKSGVVVQALQAQGLETQMRAIVTSPAQSRRRVVLSGRRTKKGAILGFHGGGSDVLVDVDGCQIVDPAITKAREALKDLVVLAASRSSEVKLHVTVSNAGLDVLLTGGKPLDRSLREVLATWCGTADVARLTWQDEQIATLRPPVQVFGGTTVVPPAGAFLQATPDGEAALIAAVLETMDGARKVVDLFAGCGTFSLPLARRAEVYAVEGLAPLLSALDHGWRMGQGLKQVTTETRDLFRRPLMDDELRPFDAVVLDPPRAGAEAQVQQIAASRVSRVGFVSCNPVTFARDAHILVDAGFGLDWVQPVDQFRWSTHIEMAAQFSR